jgi:hypothetical protein
MKTWEEVHGEPDSWEKVRADQEAVRKKREAQAIEDARSREYARKRIIEILDSLGIEIDISACGCCDGPRVKLRYKGEELEIDSYAYIDTFK